MRRMIGVDVGGTFTDIVDLNAGEIEGRKIPTTRPQSDGVVEAVRGGREDLFMHGTTAATNALLEGAGGRVAFLTDAGYEDLIEIARQDRPALYDMSADRPEPLVPRHMRFGVEGDPGSIAHSLEESSPEVIAVGLIGSHADPSGEQALKEELQSRLDVPVMLSSEVSPEFREYERFATTVLSAYLAPSVAGYLEELDRRIPTDSRLIMTSSGGLITFLRGREAAGRLLLSGPAGGAVAAAALGAHHGQGTVLSFDMGGTSTDVCRISGGRLAVGSGHIVGGRVNRVPSVPIRTIGAGGGSVAWVDPGGSLRVGPRSAGSVPGPAAYGQGGSEPTVTDANLLAGNIPADLRLGGEVLLNRDLAQQAVGRVGRRLGLEVDETAEGILEIVDSHMERALRSVSVEEGADPREAVLVAFGGAGGLHASKLASRLGIERVLVPPLSGVFSALGLLLSRPRADAAKTVMLEEGDVRLTSELHGVETQAGKQFVTTFSSEPMSTSLTADMRYVGQSHELEISVADTWGELRSRFEQAHQDSFGFRRAEEPIEVVNLRAVANGEAPITWADLPDVGEERQPRGEKGVWDRATLPQGFSLDGPALVVETNSAVLVPDGDTLTVLHDGTLEIVSR